MGEPVTQSVQLGDTTLRPAEFEKLVTEMLTRNATVPGRRPETQRAQWAPLTQVPPAKSYTMRELPRSRAPAAATRTFRSAILIGSAQTAAVLAASQIVINTRSDLSAFDLATGQRVWSQSVGGEAAKTGQWWLVPMHPLFAGKKIFARRLLAAGPELVCIADNKLLWRSPRTDLVASDPCLLGDRLLAVTFARRSRKCCNFR